MLDTALDSLPDLPQRTFLAQVVHILWQQQDVQAIWLGGSLARGNADQYSDIDLRVAITPEALEAWQRPDFARLFQGQCQADLLIPFGEDAFMHHVLLSNGDIYDLWIQSTKRAPSLEPRLILACRHEVLAQRLEQVAPPISSSDQPAAKDIVRRVIVDFWISSHKHRKVLHRGLHLLAHTGVQLDRAALMRLWYVLETGKDNDLQRPTIHGLTNLTRTVEQAKGAMALEILGAPLASREQIFRAIEQIRDEVSLVGRELAQRMGFEYPYALEATVRHSWAEFKSQ